MPRGGKPVGEPRGYPGAATSVSEPPWFVSHLLHVLSSPIARFRPNHVNSSATAHLPPSSRSFRAWPLVSLIRAQPLVSHLLHVLSSPIARFRPNRVNSSATARLPPSTRSLRARPLVSHPTVLIRAQRLVSHLPCVLLSLIVRLPPQLCLSELERSSPTRTVSIQA